MFFTSLTRMWLTRSFKPFVFSNKYDSFLNYEDCDTLGLYVHIPFCRQICNFCPYCKELYSEEKMNRYIDHLIEEINMVGKMYFEKYGCRKKTTSLYFGGGTPALAADRIKEIVMALEKYFEITEGIGLELHPDNITDETLSLLKDAGITKISIGIQSFQDKFLGILGRKKFDYEKMAAVLKRNPFETVSMDFIFALPQQTFEDIKTDVEMAFNGGANHIAIYPFIDFSFTNSPVNTMAKKEKHRLLDDITIYCNQKGYRRDSIWTFANDGKAKYSSMTRDTFLGFGCSATTLLRDQFKINTFSVDEYCKRIDEKNPATSLTIKFTRRQRMIYFLFWTAYSTSVDPASFKKFFGTSLKKEYAFEIFIAKKFGFATEDENGVYHMTMKGAFYYHYYENFYTLSYIDQMWSKMRKVAFPDRLVIR